MKDTGRHRTSPPSSGGVKKTMRKGNTGATSVTGTACPGCPKEGRGHGTRTDVGCFLSLSQMTMPAGIPMDAFGLECGWRSWYPVRELDATTHGPITVSVPGLPSPRAPLCWCAPASVCSRGRLTPHAPPGVPCVFKPSPSVAPHADGPQRPFPNPDDYRFRSPTAPSSASLAKILPTPSLKYIGILGSVTGRKLTEETVQTDSRKKPSDFYPFNGKVRGAGNSRKVSFLGFFRQPQKTRKCS